MILEHYTAEPFVLEQREYEQPDAVGPYDKPNGLWLSVKGEDDWLSWCREAEFRAEALVHCTRIEIDPAANILHIGPNGMEIGEFENRYGRESQTDRIMRSWRGTWTGHVAINWRNVARDYDGIIIAPYHWADRLERNWYYPWDCASGCIWNTAVVRVSERVER